MTDSSKKRALIVRPFRDAGTGKDYRKGDRPLLSAGAFANYAAAGLATEAPAPKPKAAPETDAPPAADA